MDATTQMFTAMNNIVSYCKKLHADGYTNKQIHLITKLSPSSITRVLQGKTYKDVDANDFVRDSRFEDRIHVLNTLLEYHEIGGGIGLDDNNKIYIQILKRAGATFDKVHDLYYDIGIKTLRQAWTYPAGQIADFDGTALNITAAEVLDLLKEQEDEN